MSAPRDDNATGQGREVNEAKSNEQLPLCLGLERTGKPKRTRQKSGGNRWQRYEQLKAQYADQATTSFDYEAACRRAAEEAGV